MKIKPVDNEHLMVILSRMESNYLGIYPSAAMQSFYSQFILSRIFAVACNYCDFVPKGNKIDIQIKLRQNGDTMLLFSKPIRKKYKIKAESTLLICIFPDCDALITLMKALRRAPVRPERLKLFHKDGRYIAIVYKGAADLCEIKTFFGEYANIKTASYCKLEAVVKNGKSIGEVNLKTT